MGVDFIDYTYLQKRGIIKKEEDKPSGVKMTNDGFLDLNNSAPETAVSAYPNNDILGSLTGVAETSSNSSAENNNPLSFFDNVSSNSASTIPSNSGENLEVQGLKLKIDDLEYKLSNLLEKMAEISSKLAEFEERVPK